MTDKSCQKLDLEYPCQWGYTLIGADQALIRRAVRELAGDREHSLAPSNRSRTGKYCSFHLELVVEDEQERVSLYQALRSHRDILMVM